ncbi:hypothetical protein JCM19055_2908 [Geomicrobium sp. JCM 19055]|nr:hypothetical protein JCM19055_2908 [Geomicrobium sp. JCM 19055]
MSKSDNESNNPAPILESKDQLGTFLSTKLNEIAKANQTFTRELLEKKDQPLLRRSQTRSN